MRQLCCVQWKTYSFPKRGTVLEGCVLFSTKSSNLDYDVKLTILNYYDIEPVYLLLLDKGIREERKQMCVRTCALACVCVDGKYRNSLTFCNWSHGRSWHL